MNYTANFISNNLFYRETIKKTIKFFVRLRAQFSEHNYTVVICVPHLVFLHLKQKLYFKRLYLFGVMSKQRI